MKLTHINKNGDAIMVDVSHKDETVRTARASGSIKMSSASYLMIKEGTAKKGDVIATARITGIMATKQTSSLIPLCHPLFITKAEVEFIFNDDQNSVTSIVTTKCVGKTGIEMEALTGCSISLLTIYDMLKAVDRSMIITDVKLLSKDGGKSGHYERLI
jgi:cyclic pyranopterin phosphate synthase